MERRNVISKIFSILMVFVVCLNGITAQAYGNDGGITLANITEEDIEECITITALDWAALIQPDADVTVKEINAILI